MPEPPHQSSRHTTSADTFFTDDFMANAALTLASKGTVSRGQGQGHPSDTNAGHGANSRSVQGIVCVQVVQAKICILIVLDEP